MKRVWQQPAMVLTGFFFAAMYAMPQATISARPGAINYIEGHAYIDGQELSSKDLGRTMLDPNQKLSTDLGKAEVLLTPGVFLRIGDNSEIRMVSPSLSHTQVEVTKGEAIIEVAEIYKGSDLEILSHGGSAVLEKVGLYRVSAENVGSIAVYDGKAEVTFGTRKVDVKKGKEVLLSDNLGVVKFDTKRADELYAWSNIRAEYDASASYSTAKNAYSNSLSGLAYGGFNSYGYNGFYNPGWYWNSGFNSYAWLPGAGYAYSPFGWGFFSPGYIAYAPVVYAPVRGGGGVVNRPVPVNPNKPPTGSNGFTMPRGPSGFSRGATASAGAVPGRITSAQASQARGTAISSGTSRSPSYNGGGGSGGGARMSTPSAAPSMARSPSGSPHGK